METIPAIPLPPPDYWTTYGFLGVCAGIGIVGAVVWFLTVTLPGQRSKQRIEISREEKSLQLTDTLRETLPVLAQTQQSLVAVAERLEERQGPHADECKRTSEKVAHIAEKVEKIASSLKLGNA